MQNKIQNDDIGGRVGVVPIKEKIVENRLRWFRPTQRRVLEVLVRRIDKKIWNPLKRGRGRSKRAPNKVIEWDILVSNISKDLVDDKEQWRHMIYVTDPT